MVKVLNTFLRELCLTTRRQIYNLVSEKQSVSLEHDSYCKDFEMKTIFTIRTNFRFIASFYFRHIGWDFHRIPNPCISGFVFERIPIIKIPKSWDVLRLRVSKFLLVGEIIFLIYFIVLNQY